MVENCRFFTEAATEGNRTTGETSKYQFSARKAVKNLKPLFSKQRIAVYPTLSRYTTDLVSYAKQQFFVATMKCSFKF